jgi:2-C-methyl-D-erythritol 4-phosphate cytidylyltransferase
MTQGLRAIAIIFAGGNGSRMRPQGPPKQFVRAGDRPILVHTLQHFQDHPRIAAIHVSCLEGYIEHAWGLVERYRLHKVRTIVAGGATAQESILKALDSATADGVADEAPALIHDGVRPIIDADLISRNIDAVLEHGSAVTSIPCFETIARSLDGGRCIESVTQRELMHVLQAPQSFRLGEARRVNHRAVEDGLLGRFVDQAQLMSHYGRRLHMVPGLRGNAKLTTEYDLLQFSLLLRWQALEALERIRAS